MEYLKEYFFEEVLLCEASRPRRQWRYLWWLEARPRPSHPASDCSPSLTTARMGIWPSGTSALHLVVITLALFAGVLPGSVTAIQAPGTDALSRLQPFSRQTQVGHNLPKPPVFPKTFQVWAKTQRSRGLNCRR